MVESGLKVCSGTKVLHSSSGVSKGVSGECGALLAVKTRFLVLESKTSFA